MPLFPVDLPVLLSPLGGCAFTVLWQPQASLGSSPGQIVLMFFSILDVHQQVAQLLPAWPPSQGETFPHA